MMLNIDLAILDVLGGKCDVVFVHNPIPTPTPTPPPAPVFHLEERIQLLTCVEHGKTDRIGSGHGRADNASWRNQWKHRSNIQR